MSAYSRILPLTLLGVALSACSGGAEAPACTGDTAAANADGLAPVVYDDGRSTYFRFPGQQRVPTVYVVLPDGREGAVNSSVSGDLVTAHQIAPAWVLRDGQRVACITNRAYDPVGVRTGTGTSSPDVERVAR